MSAAIETNGLVMGFRPEAGSLGFVLAVALNRAHTSRLRRAG